MGQGVFWLKQMFTGFSFSTSAVSLVLQQLTPVYLVTLVCAVIAATPVNASLKKCRGYEVLVSLLSFAGLLLCILSLAGGTYNPFIYFRF